MEEFIGTRVHVQPARFRAICVFFICFLLFVIVGLLIYFFMSGPKMRRAVCVALSPDSMRGPTSTAQLELMPSGRTQIPQTLPCTTGPDSTPQFRCRSTAQ